MGFKTFTAGSTLPASDINTYLMQQAVIVCTSATRPGSPVQGMLIYETDTSLFQAYTGSAWLPMSGTSGWTQYTPTWATTGTAPSLGNGTVAGYYKQVGKAVHFKFGFFAGTTTTFGTGSWTFSLPSGMTTPNQIEQCLVGRAAPNGSGYQCIGIILNNDNKINVQSVTSGSNSLLIGVDASHPGTWTAAAASFLTLTGTFEIQ